MKGGTLIVFEGVDGSGKTTQLGLLADALEARGRSVLRTREPTDGRFGRRIRGRAQRGSPIAPDEELRWFVEDRREHVRDVLVPALAAGTVVLCDRYFLSTVAYQGSLGHDPAGLLAESEAEFPLPDLVILLEVAPARGLARVSSRGTTREHGFEEAPRLERVAAIFAGIDRDYLRRVDGSRSESAVAADVLALAEAVLS